MITITVNASRSYDILLAPGILDRCGCFCAERLGVGRALLVSDDTVNALYGDRAEASLRAAGYETTRFVIPYGEHSKNTDSLVSLLGACAEQGLTRTDLVIALGGGVVGDLAGFAAAVYLRGIRFVQIPTTLLAMVDSSVGGKTAVDLKAGKNLVGAFHQPSLVLCDPDTLATLPRRIFCDGCAEVIKYGMIADEKLCETLRTPIEENLMAVIADCIRIKRDIVQADEFDTGLRQILNFGHTPAHAIEACSHFAISHGEAVAMGMRLITAYAVRAALCPPDCLSTLDDLLARYELDAPCPFTADELTPAALSDKKRAGDTIRLILPTRVGECRIESLPVTALRPLFADGLAAK